MIFSRNRNLDLEGFTPKINNVPIEKKNVVKFLGVLVDDKLTWRQHIAAVKAKMSRHIGIMYKLRSVLPLAARLQIFNSLVQSHVSYCTLVWGSSCKNNIDTLFTTQKKAMRSVIPGFVNYYYKDGLLPTHTKSAFNEYNVLTVYNIILKNMLIYVHKILHMSSSVPLYVQQTLAPNIPIPGNPPDNHYDWYNQYNSIPLNRTSFF